MAGGVEIGSQKNLSKSNVSPRDAGFRLREVWRSSGLLLESRLSDSFLLRGSQGTKALLKGVCRTGKAGSQTEMVAGESGQSNKIAGEEVDNNVNI